MAVRPPSIAPGVWKGLSKPTQNALSNSAGIAPGRRTAVQKAAWARVRAMPATGGGAPKPQTAGGGGYIGRQGPNEPGDDGPDPRNVYAELGVSGLNASNDILKDPAKLAKLFHMAGFTGSVQDILKQLDLAGSFAGAEQFRQNVTGQQGNVAANDYLQNVDTLSASSNMNTLRRYVNEMVDDLENGRDPQAKWAKRQALVPAWAPPVYDELKAKNIPWSTELFTSPSINYSDPSKPLFAQGQHPASLIGLTGLQQGEESVYRGASAAELMSQMYPAYYAYAHRPAGAPVPAGLEAGMTLGSPVLGPNGQYTRSPLASTSLYQRNQALGEPGVAPEFSGLDAASLLAATPGSGPSYFAPGSWGEQFAPWNLDPTTLARLQATLYGADKATTPGGAEFGFSDAWD